MSMTAEDLRAALASLLPITSDGFEIRLDSDGTVEFDDGGLGAALQLMLFGEAGEIVDMKVQFVQLVPADAREDGARALAYLEGWARATPALVANLFGGNLSQAMPADLVFEEALREGEARTADDYARWLAAPDGPAARWNAERLAAKRDEGDEGDDAGDVEGGGEPRDEPGEPDAAALAGYRYFQIEHEAQPFALPPDDAAERALSLALGGPPGPPSGQALGRLRELEVCDHRLADLRPLAAARGLRRLEIRSRRLEDLGPLSALVELEELTLRDVPASDLGPLRALTRLRALHLVDTAATDLGPLGGLAALRELRMERAAARDLGPLAGLVALEELDLSGCPVEDVAPLAGLHRVRRLYLYNTRVCDVAPLAGMASLSVLGLSGAPVRDVSVAAALPSLRAVLLSRSGVRSLGDLPARLPHVTFEGLAQGPEAARPRPAPSGSVSAQFAEHAALWAERGFDPERHRRLGELEVALVATRDPGAIGRLAAKRAFWTEGGETLLRGLILQSGGGVPFADNPWGIPAHATLGDALGGIWGPLAPLAPHLLAHLRRETLALALFEPSAGALRLGYVHLARREGHELRADGITAPAPAHVDLGRLAEWSGYASIGVMIGAAPDPSFERSPAFPGAPAPLAMRELFAAHAGLSSGMENILSGGAARSLARLLGRRARGFPKRAGGRRAEQFVLLSGDGAGNGHVFDLDALDGRGDPLVCSWDHETWEVGAGRPFWDWFDEHVPRAMLGLPIPG